ncbi:hypothetical protein FPQ18DRAFT_390580 [Pyronema domesticum]|nr:hypothetical protein FPQ18DRAFT_390580 [Pyronema domesticum]
MASMEREDRPGRVGPTSGLSRGAYEALAELIRDTRLGTRMERATKEEERERNWEEEGGGELGADGDDLEEDEDEEEWEEDEELVGAVAEPVLLEEALGAAGRWLFDEFGGAHGDV